MLRIAKIKFTAKSGKPGFDTFKDKILSALDKLPKPDIVYGSACTIKPEETILALQTESVYVDLLNPIENLNNIKYLGSNLVYNCIVLYLHTDTDHLLVHVDNGIAALNLLSIVSNFSYKDKIDVYLIGGIKGNPKSLNTLEKIILELYDIAIKLKINIEIKKQFLMNRNIPTKESRQQELYDYVIERSDILSRQLYNTPLNDLDFASVTFKHFNKIKINDKDIKTEEYSLWETVAYMTIEFYSNDHNLHIIKSNQNKIKHDFNDKNAFLKSLYKIFSKNGFDFLDSLIEKQKVQIPNFVINMDAKKVHLINQKFYTPYFDSRTIYSYADVYNCRYLNSYNSKLTLWKDLKISDKTENACKEIANEVKDLNVVSRPEMEKIIKSNFGIATSIPYQNILIKCSQDYLSNKDKIILNSYCLFRQKSAYENLYEESPIAHSNLLVINNLTNKNFNAMVRKKPAYTVDALLTCSSYDQAQAIKDILDSKDITSYIINTEDGEKIKYYELCVPGINVEQCARNISNAGLKK